MRARLVVLLVALLSIGTWQEIQGADGPAGRRISGIDPALAMFNDDGECGTGAVVPWANRLWVVTYSPHRPSGSSDKLYEITPKRQQIIRPESIGGTPANRMIHVESQQLFIGPYAISKDGDVRVIPYSEMFGRPTGNARHLFEPVQKIYCASMEEALYEIDVETLAVTELFADEAKKTGRHSNLPGYHGKGLYSSADRVIYANNGEHGGLAQTKPDIPSGVLAEWDGKSPEWTVVTRNQFTEVTGPDGILGNLRPEGNPVWAVGWDHRSLILMCLDHGKWSRYRLVKSSHSYDGAHGWNTEWPRIREIGDGDLLMTMHGAFWRFPANFRPGHTQGIRQRSAYLKIIGDFCLWNGEIVLGCDDSAKNEFLNTRKAKGKLPGPAQSQSNLWFIHPDQLDEFGPAAGKGSVWIDDVVKAGVQSDAMQVGGFDECTVFLRHDSKESREFVLEIDATGTDHFTELSRFTIPAGEGEWRELALPAMAEWVRVVPGQDCKQATATFSLKRKSSLEPFDAELVQSLALPETEQPRGGYVRAGSRETGLQVLATAGTPGSGKVQGYYELDADLELIRQDAPEKQAFMSKEMGFRPDVISLEGNSVLFVDDDGSRYRLPVGNQWFKDHPQLLNQQRIAREVCTERDLMQAAGTFYELPARNAGGFRKIRPVCTHTHFIQDYCTWRGLLVLTGVTPDAVNDTHVIRSADGQAAVWLGCVDDLWKFGAPRGTGGPWTDTHVNADDVSDPFLLTGYGRKELSVQSSQPVHIAIECDIHGTGVWSRMGELRVDPANKQNEVTLLVSDGTSQQHKAQMGAPLRLPEVFSNASWIRFRADRASVISILLNYE